MKFANGICIITEDVPKLAWRKHEQHREKAGQGGEGALPVSLFLMLGFCGFG